MRLLIVMISILFANGALAQMRIIPQTKIEEAANPRTVATSLRFVKPIISFGEIDEMSGVWRGVAHLVNSGKDTLSISAMKSTCGCLQVAMRQRVLPPKATSEVELRYYPRGHAGRVFQRVMFYSNLSDREPSAILELRGLVVASADRSDDYPYCRGALRLRRDAVSFRASERQVERIACMNGGSTRLMLGVDTMLTSPDLRVRFEPSVLEPKQEGDMVVEYTPKSPAKGSKRVYIKGLPLPPRECVIEVKIEDK